jgi:hypothetical protein
MFTDHHHRTPGYSYPIQIFGTTEHKLTKGTLGCWIEYKQKNNKTNNSKEKKN